ncbi:MAG: deaminase [Verrucomicrobiota bacterium]
MHGEAHSLMRAWKYTDGALPANLTLYVDRKPCPICMNHLSKVKELVGVENLTVFTKAGDTFPF